MKIAIQFRNMIAAAAAHLGRGLFMRGKVQR